MLTSFAVVPSGVLWLFRRSIIPLGGRFARIPSPCFLSQRGSTMAPRLPPSTGLSLRRLESSCCCWRYIVDAAFDDDSGSVRRHKNARKSATKMTTRRRRQRVEATVGKKASSLESVVVGGPW